jgi:uncharacterized caspase-like protein
MAADDHAIVVGIATYPFLDSLSGPENDARAFTEWLEAADGGNMPLANIDCILSSDRPPASPASSPEPTTVRLDEVFERVIDRSESHGGRGGRRLYVYLAGHGFAPTLDDVVLLTANAARGRTGHHLPGKRYADWFRKAAFFDEVVMFMDCCRERYGKVAVRQPPWDDINGQVPSRYFYGFATEWSRASREGPYGQAGAVRGLFTLSLLAGLRNAERNPNGELTGTMLKDFIYNYIHQLSEGIGATQAQEPEFDYRNEIVFLTNPAVPAAHPAATLPSTWTVRVKLRPESRGKGVDLVAGDERTLPPAASGPVRWEWRALPDGLYRLRLGGQGADYLELIGEGGVRNVQL